MTIVQLALVMASAAGTATAEIKTSRISDSLYVLHGGNGQGAHVGLSVGDDGVLLVDSMNSVSCEKLDDAIDEISEKPVRIVLNTHSHSDHTGCNSYFADLGALVISHQNFSYTDVAFDLGVRDEFSLKFNGDTIRATHIKAHTHNDLLIHFSQNDALFMGDVFTNIWHPTGFSFGYAAEQQALNKALEIAGPDTKIVPGHGEIDSRSGIHAVLTNLGEWHERVAELVRARQTPEEMATDGELNRLRANFVEKRAVPEMPDDRFRRFVDRTLSADYVTVFPLGSQSLEQFGGAYQLDSGSVSITVKQGVLESASDGNFLERLIPISQNEFHIQTSLGGRYRFQRDASGKVVGFTRIAGGTEKAAVRH